jgi:NAD(P)-dependent dehydrogenase (short-subunit alcohol dehydrogenase family)
VRIIVVGGAETIGKAAVKALSDRHEVVVVGRRSGTVHVDIGSPDSVRAMYHQVGSFNALVCAAGDAYLGPFDSMSGSLPLASSHTRTCAAVELPP